MHRLSCEKCGCQYSMSKAHFGVVLFDLDGTLIDTNHLIETSFRYTLREKLGLDVSAEQIYPYFGEPLVTTMARFSPERATELVEFYRAFNLANHDALIRQFAGVREALASLRAAGVTLGVVTSKRLELAKRGLQVTGLAPYFATLVAVEDTEQHKPDPAPALKALERLGEQSGSHVLMVGDSRFDILCGKNAGLKTAAVGWTLQDRAKLEAMAVPDYWVEEPAELVGLALG